MTFLCVCLLSMNNYFVLELMGVSHFREILSNLEIGIRKFIPKLPLPAVFTDATAQMITIKKFLASVFSCEVSYAF